MDCFVETMDCFVETMDCFVETMDCFVETMDCFVETIDCFILRCFEKRLKIVFQMDELLKPKQPIDSKKQPIVCFGTITEKWFLFRLGFK